jgi:medium-chain acyl-[acyl-carrier-protein] hydrolase
MFLSAVGEVNTSLAHDEEYMDAVRFMLPTLRADFTLCECYSYTEEDPLPCNVSVWGGDADPDIGLAQLVGWREQTAANFSLTMFAGDHFFLMSQKKVVLRELADSLEPLLVLT